MAPMPMDWKIGSWFQGLHGACSCAYAICMDNSSKQIPSVGRIVLVMLGGEWCAAIVTRVWSDTCINATVFDAIGHTYGYTSLVQGDGELNWCWPPRVGGVA